MKEHRHFVQNGRVYRCFNDNPKFSPRPAVGPGSCDYRDADSIGNESTSELIESDAILGSSVTQVNNALAALMAQLVMSDVSEELAVATLLLLLKAEKAVIEAGIRSGRHSLFLGSALEGQDDAVTRGGGVRGGLKTELPFVLLLDSPLVKVGWEPDYKGENCHAYWYSLKYRLCLSRDAVLVAKRDGTRLHVIVVDGDVFTQSAGLERTAKSGDHSCEEAAFFHFQGTKKRLAEHYKGAYHPMPNPCVRYKYYKEGMIEVDEITGEAMGDKHEGL